MKKISEFSELNRYDRALMTFKNLKITVTSLWGIYNSCTYGVVSTPIINVLEDLFWCNTKPPQLFTVSNSQAIY